MDQLGGSSSGARNVLRDTADLLDHFETSLDVDSWNRAITAMSNAARVITYGIGPSGCLADYLSINLKRTGVRSKSITVTGFSLADHLLDTGEDDVFVVFATMRRFREIDMVIDHATNAGATLILVTETLGVALRDRVDIVLNTPPTTTGTSDGVVMGMVVASALKLSVAKQHQPKAVETLERLNTLRADIVGGKLDAEI
jgi:DNA-binding MurR/RpiR family transcriptional regulator